MYVVTLMTHGEQILRNAVLMRHAEPLVEPNRPPAEWHLSSQGRSFSYELATCLNAIGLRRIVTSPEAKAAETAAVVADVLGVSVIVDDRLREVRRPWTGSHFESAVASYLTGERHEGWEPIRAVVSRLQDSLVNHTGAGPVGLVTHGTAMACLLDSLCLVEPAQFWSELTMPDAWTFDGERILRLYLTDT